MTPPDEPLFDHADDNSTTDQDEVVIDSPAPEPARSARCSFEQIDQASLEQLSAYPAFESTDPHRQTDSATPVPPDPGEVEALDRHGTGTTNNKKTMVALYIKYIRLGHFRLRIMAFVFTSKEIYEAVLQALQDEPEMWFILIAYRATLEDERSYVSLLSKHPRVYVAVSDVFFHAKDILIDNTYFITGSANLSNNGMSSNIESSTAFKGGAPFLIGLCRCTKTSSTRWTCASQLLRHGRL